MDRKKVYSEKLRDPRWQKRRLEIFQRDEFSCQICQDNKSTLNVHHRRYIPGNEPWDYQDHDLVTLCETCHGEEQEAWRYAIESITEAMCASGYFSTEVRQLAWTIMGAPGHPHYFLDLIEFMARNTETCELVSQRFREQHVNANRSEAVTPARTASE